MSVIVISCGRTGTNVCLSILSGNSNLKADPVVENKNLFKFIQKYPNNYLAKADIHYMSNVKKLDDLMKINPNMKMIWTIRDPRDVILSKIRRGQPKNMGGDNLVNTLSSDATPRTAIQSVNNMFEKYTYCKANYPNRTFLVKMEDMLLDTETTAKQMCEFIDVPFEEKMVDFPQKMENKYKVKRYGRKIHKNQVGLWKNWETIYGGFFVKGKYEMNKHFKELNRLIKYFHYE